MSKFKDKAKLLVQAHMKLMEVEKQLLAEETDPAKVSYLEKVWANLQSEENQLLDELAGLDV